MELDHKRAPLYFYIKLSSHKLKQSILDLNRSDFLRNERMECMKNAERYGIYYDEEKKGLFCTLDIEPNVRFALYHGWIRLTKDKRRIKEMLGKENHIRKELCIRDFNRYEITLCEDLEAEGLLTVTADPMDTSVPRNVRGEFLNHSCFEPNCEMHPRESGVGGLLFVSTVTKQRIPAGTELTVNYGKSIPMKISDCQDLVRRFETQGIQAVAQPCTCSGGRCGKAFLVIQSDDTPRVYEGVKRRRC
jgi:hypothetical protein